MSLIHIKIRTKGSSRKKLEFFNWLIGQFDPDYPFVRECHRNPNNDLYTQYCTECGGSIWKNPAITIEELLRLVVQINSMKTIPGDLKYSITQYGTETRCAEILLTRTAHPADSAGVESISTVKSARTGGTCGIESSASCSIQGS